MGSAGFTLADRLGAKSLPCSVPGCARTWISLAGSGKGLKLGGRSAPDPKDPASAMCDPCREKFAGLGDVERSCARPGCTGTWTWPVAAQMTAFATKQPAPTILCAGCETKLAALEDKAIPCSVPGCTRSSVFTKKAQLLAGAPDVEPVSEATRPPRPPRPPGHDVRSLRRCLQEAEEPPGQLRHQRLQAQVDLVDRGADHRLRHRQAQ